MRLSNLKKNKLGLNDRHALGLNVMECLFIKRFHYKSYELKIIHLF